MRVVVPVFTLFSSVCIYPFIFRDMTSSSYTTHITITHRPAPLTLIRIRTVAPPPPRPGPGSSFHLAIYRFLL